MKANVSFSVAVAAIDGWMKCVEQGRLVHKGFFEKN
jgi:hypothetical protein